MRRTVSIMVAVGFMLIPAITLGFGSPDGFLFVSGLAQGDLFGQANAHIAENFPGRRTLEGWSFAIRVLGGQREYNQIFVSGDELIPVLNPPVHYFVHDNTQAILMFAEHAGAPVYAMIIPTVSAIRQQSLPYFFLGQSVNQLLFIEEVYAQMLGRVSTVDAYNALFGVREQYIFYRTENNLTALGGFHIYYELAGRLLDGIARPSFQHFDIEHVKYDFLGELYRRSPFQHVRGDIISIFRYRRVPREYLVTQLRGGQWRTFHTLFPLHTLEANQSPMDVYLGGLGAKTIITTSSPYRNNLLVVGDHTALAYLPFLANHYRTITLIDLSQMGLPEYAAVAELIGAGFYDQILFAYSIETYMHRPYPSWAVGLLPPDEDY